MVERLQTGRRGSLLVALLLAGVCCGSGSPARAGTALDYTREVLERARAIVNADHPHNQKLAELEKLLEGFLDTDYMGKDALGEHVKHFTATQQQEFLKLFRTLFQRTYLQKLLFFDKPVFEYVGEAAAGALTQVNTKIVTPRDEFLVSYRMRAASGRWLATDIQVEDLSLTSNFRQQLDRQLSKGAVDTLLDSMRRKFGGATDDTP
ncbi:MAG: ABC transporter substrate-binding protein [Deltaproteobacteria bacterium]|nr:ABC transporter substrate-binding protein [Deltaproteobacteria bacterium]